MTSPVPLTGIDPIERARANVAEGIAVPGRQCGSGEDTLTFERELERAREAIGVEIDTFADIGKKAAFRDRGFSRYPDPEP